jgi:hypothetical protein
LFHGGRRAGFPDLVAALLFMIILIAKGAEQLAAAAPEPAIIVGCAQRRPKHEHWCRFVAMRMTQNCYGCDAKTIFRNPV